MKTGESLLSIGKFIAEYSAHLMGAGVHTSRVVRNTKRIGEAFGLDVKLSVFHRNIILTIIDKETNEACNEVIDIPAHPISFEHNSELSAGEKDQSLCCIYSLGFCCFPVCFHRADFRHNFGDCHGNQRALSSAWGSLD